MNWIEGFVYGIISGFTELLPVSSQAHQRILIQLFGVDGSVALSNLIVHICMLVAMLFGSRRILQRLGKEQKLTQRGRRRMNSADVRSRYDLRLVRGAIFPLMLLMLGLIFTRTWVNNIFLVSVFSVVNGIIIFISERFPHGNKDARHVSVLDAVIFGIFGALSVLPGISRVGASQSYATMRGVDRQQSFQWALVLSIPAIVVLCVFDIVAISGSNGMSHSFSVIAGCVTAGIGAFIGMYMSIVILSKAVRHMHTSVFAYYSWGVGLFSLVLYLIS